MTKPLAGILIVDDHEPTLKILEKMLSGHYNVYTAIDGVDALEKLEEYEISLLISDIIMPRMNGIRLCEKIKTNVAYSHIPVILLTVNNAVQEKVEGLHNGADAYIEKPFSPAHLNAQIFSLLHNRIRLREYFAREPASKLESMAQSKTDALFLGKLEAIIDEFITDPQLDIIYLAARLNVSRSVLYRKIQSLSSLTPYEMINLARLKRAVELMKEENDRLVTEISTMVGFTSVAQFSKNFKKQFGVTPSQYIEKKER